MDPYQSLPFLPTRVYNRLRLLPGALPAIVYNRPWAPYKSYEISG